MPSGRIVDILNGKRAISAETALRLGRYLPGIQPRTIRISLIADRAHLAWPRKLPACAQHGPSSHECTGNIMPPVQHASQIAGQDKQQVTAQDATQATRQRVLVGALALGIAFSLSMQTVSAQTNTVRYDDIAGKAKQAPGPAVAISTNYFLAWTGAWPRNE